MQKNRADYTNTFLKIEGIKVPNEAIYNDEEFQNWLKKWAALSKVDKKLMRKSNPVYIPRNHFVESALYSASEEQNMKPFNDMLKVLSNPYEYNAEFDDFMNSPNDDLENEYQTFCGT